MAPKKGKVEEEPEAAPPEEQNPTEKYKLPVDVVAEDPRSLKYLLESPEVNVVIASTRALCKFAAESAANRIQLREIGCISALMSLLVSKSQELQLAVTETLEKIAMEEANRAELTERGALAAFLDMLVGKNMDLKSVAATAMQWMSEDAVTRQAVYRAHEIAEKCKKDVEDDKQTTLGRGPSPPKQRGLPEPPATAPPSPPRSPARFEDNEATKSIDNLERCTMGLLALPKRPKDKPDVEMINKGLATLGHFADDCISRHDLAGLGCIPVLTSMLSLNYDDRTEEDDLKLNLMKQRAASSLSKLAAELTLRPLMRTTAEMKNFGSVGPLATLHAGSDNAQVRTSCASAMSNLALDAQSRLDLLQCFGASKDHVLYGAVISLALRSHEGDAEEVLPCVQALARISAQPIGCDAVISAGMLTHAAEMLNAERIEAAGEAEAATEDVNVLTLHHASIVVANCLTRPLPADNDKVRREFAAVEGLDKFMDLVKAEGIMKHPEVLSRAMYVVMQLAEDMPTRSKAIELGLVSEIPRILGNEAAEVRTAAAYVMATLAYDMTARSEMDEAGVVAAIMALLSDEGQPVEVQASSLFCITNAVRDSLIRSKVVDEMSLGKKLVKILNGSDSDVLKNALRCTCAIASDTKNAVQLCFDGVLQKAEYHETSQSKAVRKYASETLKRITDANLPAKLWQKSRLGEQDRTTGGVFYDVGKYDKWLPLQQLKAIPPNSYQAEVLVWDLDNDPKAQRWVEEAKAGVEDCMPEVLEQIGFLARFVSKILGGSMTPEAYFNKFDVSKFMRKAKREANSQCVSMGNLSNGGTRHRALLLKFLADYCDVDCSLERGPFKRGAHAFHSWNVVTTETKERLIVDLVFAPGVVYVEGSEEARQYQCRDEYAFSSLCQ